METGSRWGTSVWGWAQFTLEGLLWPDQCTLAAKGGREATSCGSGHLCDGPGGSLVSPASITSFLPVPTFPVTQPLCGLNTELWELLKPVILEVTQLKGQGPGRGISRPKNFSPHTFRGHSQGLAATLAGTDT